MAAAVEDLRMGNGNGQGVHSFFMPRKGARASVSHEGDGGPNRDRRKRRRTESPDRGPDHQVGGSSDSWYQQLTADASDAPPRPDSNSGLAGVTKSTENYSSSTTAGGCKVMTDASQSKNSVSRKSKSRESPRRKDASGLTSISKQIKQPTCLDPSTQGMPLGHTEEPRSKEEDEISASPSKSILPLEEAKSSPPKKMLKLRSDGKLLSPKSAKATTEPKAKRKRRSNESRSSNDWRVAVIRYGADQNTRSEVAQKIQNILEGRTTVPEANAKAPQESPKKAKQPSKPTHPFFLGKAAQFADSGSTMQQEPKKQGDVTEIRKSNILGISSPSKASLLSRNNETACSDVTGSFRKAPRLPGVMEAVWPPKDMVHVRPSESIVGTTPKSHGDLVSSTHQRKLKDAQIRIPNNEDVLCPNRALARDIRSKNRLLDIQGVRKPTRKVMTGSELQKSVSKNISCIINFSPLDADSFEDELGINRPQLMPNTPSMHGGLKQLYQRIPGSLTAFDKFECETTDWVHKYAPNDAEAVLQEGSEAFVLRDWLRSLTISAVESLNGPKRTRESSLSSRNAGIGVKKRRKKRAEALDGFVVSSDEEMDRLNEITIPGQLEPAALASASTKRSLVRTTDFANAGAQERSNNATVISGPHGCGKTAAVYAVAQELGFEIFEINAGSRRSGRDILDKVGDMTRNHLVNRSQESDSREFLEDAEDLLRLTDSLKQDIESGRQGTMQSFFQPKAEASKKPRGRPKKQKDVRKSRPSPKKPKFEKPSTKQSKVQKQSVILLEEVDVLFEEDKQFWATTLEMIQQSKRPVIMTCTDESLLPLENLPLSAILRFQPPPEPLAVDYLLLLAANEGHLLSRDAVSRLYETKQNDLRASIAELSLSCQMAIGDTQGGLGWFLIRSSAELNQDKNGESLRVVSEGSYLSGIHWLSEHHLDHEAKITLEHETALFSEIYDGWGEDLAESSNFFTSDAFPCSRKGSEDHTLANLRAIENTFEALSAADTCSPLGPRLENTSFLDPTLPALSEKSRANYAGGAMLLQADPLIDQTSASVDLAFTLRALARRSLPHSQPVASSWIAHELPPLFQARRTPPSVTHQTLQAAFTPLKPPLIHTFANSISTLTTDVAPYIRSITAFDLRLEEQRRQLEASRFDPRDGSSSKRSRTTRASRAALEGGAKVTTRRERWFPNQLDFNLVARTGGKDWMRASLSRTDVGIEDGQQPGNLKSAGSMSSVGGSEG